MTAASAQTPPSTDRPALYKGTIVAVCHECKPIQVIDDQGNCGCDPKLQTRQASLCPRKDWANACPNPGDPERLSRQHGVTFEIVFQPNGWLPGILTWKADQETAQKQQLHLGGRTWAVLEKKQNRPFLDRIDGGRCRLELTPPPKVLDNLTPEEARKIAEAYARLMDDIFANR